MDGNSGGGQSEGEAEHPSNPVEGGQEEGAGLAAGPGDDDESELIGLRALEHCSLPLMTCGLYRTFRRTHVYTTMNKHEYVCVCTVPSHTDPREWVRDAMRQGLSARQILEPLLGDDCPPVGLHP